MNVYMDTEEKIVKVSRLNVIPLSLKYSSTYSVAASTDYFIILNVSFAFIPFFRGD